MFRLRRFQLLRFRLRLRFLRDLRSALPRRVADCYLPVDLGAVLDLHPGGLDFA
jgi:hypothetical protein